MPTYIYTDGTDDYEITQKMRDEPLSILADVWELYPELKKDNKDPLSQVWRKPQKANIHWRYLS